MGRRQKRSTWFAVSFHVDISACRNLRVLLAFIVCQRESRKRKMKRTSALGDTLLVCKASGRNTEVSLRNTLAHTSCLFKTELRYRFKAAAFSRTHLMAFMLEWTVSDGIIIRMQKTQRHSSELSKFQSCKFLIVPVYGKASSLAKVRKDSVSQSNK